VSHATSTWSDFQFIEPHAQPTEARSTVMTGSGRPTLTHVFID